LATRGAQVYACGRSAESVARAAAAASGLATGERIDVAQVDVTDRPVFEAWIERARQETGRIDILINNAAYVQWADVEEMTVEEAQWTMRVAFDALVIGTRAVLPPMRAAGRGQIVNMGSIAGRIFVGGSSAAYAAAKAAIDAYSQTLHVELAGSPIQLLLVRLGTVAGTDFFKKYVSEERMPSFTRFLPALTPPQVAEAVVAALLRRQAILTLPRYLALLTHVYNFFPRQSRWLARRGGRRHQGYAEVEWHVEDQERS
jgi:NADP-dependent 3-hydroxy acid dehydrogenase YdfG